MPGRQYFELKRQLPEMRQEADNVGDKTVPRSIAFLEKHFSHVPETLDRFDVYLLVRDECMRAGRDDLELDFVRRCASEMPNEPVALVALADLLGEQKSLLDESIDIASDAVRVARETCRFVRLSLCSLARAYARGCNYPGLMQTIQALIESSKHQLEEDGPFDVDFLHWVPKGAVDQVLIDAYLSIAKQR